MTKNELIAEAKRRYPLNCRVKCPNNNQGNNKLTDYNTIQYVSTHGIHLYGSNVWLYLHEQWAEVISYPEGYKDNEDMTIRLIFDMI